MVARRSVTLRAALGVESAAMVLRDVVDTISGVTGEEQQLLILLARAGLALEVVHSVRDAAVLEANRSKRHRDLGQMQHRHKYNNPKQSD